MVMAKLFCALRCSAVAVCYVALRLLLPAVILRGLLFRIPLYRATPCGDSAVVLPLRYIRYLEFGYLFAIVCSALRCVLLRVAILFACCSRLFWV